MFAKDYNALNDLYDKKIINENVGLGPVADQQITPTTSKLKKVQIPPEKNCGCKEECNNEECEGFDALSYDSNSKMARQLLFRVHKLSAMLHDLLNNKDNVEAWVLSKITNAHDQLQSVFGYEDYEQALNASGLEEVEENNEEELTAAISQGGENLMKILRSSLRKESRENLEKVLLETIVLLENKK